MSRRVKIALLAVGGLLGLLALTAIVLVVAIDADDFRPRIEETARARFGREVELGELSFALLPVPALEVASLRVAGDADGPWPGEPWVEAGRIRVRASLGALLAGRLEVHGVTLVEPTVRISRNEEGTWSIEELLPEKSDEPSGEARLRLDALRIDGGRILLADASLRPGSVLRHEIAELDLSIDGLVGDGRRNVEASGVLVSAGAARFSADGSVGPGEEIDGTLQVEGLDLAPVAPFVESWTGMSELAGRLDARIDGERAAGGAVEGSVVLSLAGVRLPIALEGAPPLDADAELEVEVGAGGRVDVRAFAIELAGSSIEGSGSVTQDDGRQVVTAELRPSRIVVADIENAAKAFGLEPPLESVSGTVAAAGNLRVTRVKEGPARRLESIALDGLDVSGARLRVPLGAPENGSKNGSRGGGASADQAPAFRARDVTASDLTIELVDASAPQRTLLTLADVDLDVEAWAPGEKGPLVASAALGGGRLTAKGDVGPWSAGSPTLDLMLTATGVSFEALAPLLDSRDLPSPTTGELELATSLRRSLDETIVAKGTVTLDEVVLETDAGRRTFDLTLHHDVAVGDDGRRITVHGLAIDLPSGPLRVAGSVVREQAGATFDLRTSEPATLTGEDVDRLLALAGRAAPLTLETGEPLRADVRVRGGAGRKLALDGTAVVTRTTLRLRDLDSPVQVASASVTLDGETVRVDDAALRMGESDLAGSLRIEGFDEPEVAFTLRSRQAIIDELVDQLQIARERASSRARPADAGPPLLMRTKARGTLAVESARWKGITLSDLEATVTLRDGRLAFDPVSVATHGGRGSGTLAANLHHEPASFEAQGRVDGIDARSLLGQALGYTDLSGRADATIRLEGRAGSLEQALGSVEGRGTVALREGAIRGLDVLGALRRAEAFGERTVAQLGSRLAEEGTTFDRLDGDWSLAGGVLSIARLDATTPEMDVAGKGVVRLLAKELDLDLRVVFDRELSQRMRDEGSRAARLFWDSRQGRVSLPLRLVGAVDSPRAAIDWQAAAAQAAREAIVGELGQLGGSRRTNDGESEKPEDVARDLLGGLLGGGARREEPPEQEQPRQPVTEERRQAPQQAETSLSAQLAEARFSGNFLAPDLKIAVVLEGDDLERAELRVSSGGRVLVEERRAFADAIGAARGGRVEASMKIDAKALLGAASVTVEVVPIGPDGRRGTAARREVTRTSLF